jgi:hypothetical protein
MGSLNLESAADWIGNEYFEASAWDVADAYLYAAQRNPAQNGEHTEAMCIAGGMSDWSHPPNFYYDGCKCDVQGRMGANFSHPNYKSELSLYPYHIYRWFVRGSQTYRKIYACKPPPSSIIPAIVGMGALTLISLLGPVLGAAAASAGSGAGRRTPRRKT